MIGKILSLLKPDPGANGHPRSPHWSAVRDAFVKSKCCAACGRKDKLNVHHILPFHLYPARELDPANLIVLCEGSTACHLTLGHLGDWKRFNPHVVEDAARLLKRFQEAA